MKKELSQKTFHSLLVQFLPLVLGLILIPNFIQEMGGERFSFLSLGWAILGYFSFFDLGIGRTLTKIVAEDPDLFQRKDGNVLIFSSCSFVGMMSLFASLILFIFTDWFVGKFLTVSPDLVSELILAAKVLVFGIPMVSLTAAFRGAIEGLNDFKSANLIQFLNGIVIFVFPFLGWKFAPSMVAVSVLLIFGRSLICCLSFYLLWQKAPQLLKNKLDLRVAGIVSVLSHGGWITLGNAIAPLMANLDKVLVGGLVELAKLASYTTPMEVVGRVWTFPTAVTRILFPQLAETNKFPERMVGIFQEGNSLVLLLVFPVCLFLSVFSAEWIHFWLRDGLSAEAPIVAKILVLGIYVNCLNWVSCSWLLASKHVRWTVVTTLIEIPIFFGALFFLTKQFGVVGAALAWSFRLIFDFILTGFVLVKLEQKMRLALRGAVLGVVFGGAAMIAVSLISELLVRAVVVILICTIFLVKNRDVIYNLLPSWRRARP